MRKLLLVCFLFLTINIFGQDFNLILQSKALQFYTNVKIKPDSLAFVNCQGVRDKLSATDIYLDFMGTTMNGNEVFFLTIIQKNEEPLVIEIPKLYADNSSESKYSFASLDRGFKLSAELETQNQGYNSYTNLLGHFESFLEGKKSVYYSTSDELNFVNLKHLKGKDGKFLFEKYHLVRLHTAASFFMNNQNLILKPKLNALLVGDLSYECPCSTATGKPSNAGYNKFWTYLEGTRKETKEIYKLLKVKHQVELLDSCNATELNFVQKVNATKYDVIHLATHGFYFPTTETAFGINPKTFPLLRSGVVLSGANCNETDITPFNKSGMFTAFEFSKLNISNINLMVLSTCHSGEGSKNQSEAPLGLVLAFLRQGINAMMLSNQAVPDEETNLFMSAFYCYLSQDSNADKAFTNTLRELNFNYPKTDWSFFDLMH